MIKDENYISIQGWMINRLGLEGVNLIVYAAIYGFSQNGESIFSGSRAYLATWCTCSLSTLKRSLKTLQERGLIEQVHHSIDNMEVHYRAITDPWVKMSQGGGVKMDQALGQNEPSLGSKWTKPGVKMSQAYNDDNIEDKLEDNLVDNIVVCDDNKQKRFSKPSLEEVKQYAERNGKPVVDPVRFYDYYTANGWKVGKNPMKDWKAAFRMWEGKEKAEKPASPNKKEIKTMNETHVEEMTGKWDGKSVLQPWERQRLSPEERQRYDFWHLMKED